jgi:RND superfamily putative drug exporter
MQGLMLKLDGALRRRRRVVLALWLVAIVVAVPFAARQSENLTGGGFGVPGSMSERVEEEVARDFEQAGRGTLAAVLVPREGASGRDVRAELARVDRATREVDHVAIGRRARASALARIDRAPGRPVVVPLSVGVDEYRSADVARDLRKELGLAKDESSGPVRAHLIGQGALWAGLQDLSKEDLAKAESGGFPLVALILLLVFGSLAAAALPLALGFASVLVTGALIYALSLAMDMSVFVTNMASMVGIGVAVDYSLFVLARYREEIRAGRERDDARAAALATSGVAVVFSGLTVMASLAGLMLVNTTSLRSMAIGAIVVVAVSLLAAITLLPLLISLLGHRAYARGRLFTLAPLVLRSRRGRRRGSTHPDLARDGFWARWTRAVMRRPVLSTLAASALLLALAAPALELGTKNGALHQFPPGNETRQGFEAAASVAGRGASAPVKVVVAPGTRDAVAAVRRTLRRDPQVAAVQRPVRARDGRSALLVARLRSDGESDAAKAAVQRLRAEAPAAAPRARVDVGGPTATLVDFDDRVAASMGWVILFVLGLSYVVLLVLLRSAVLPLKAVVMNLLSVGAACGVLALVFGDVDTITPPLVLAVVFGLSMDYEVFLLSRIRERFNAGGDTQRAVAEGLATSARTISSAALIMVAVFLVFTLTGVPSIQQIGLGCAVAIAVDATIVRLVLVPAMMELLGRWNWWLPGPLERLLPESTFEELARPAPASAPAASASRA